MVNESEQNKRAKLQTAMARAKKLIDMEPSITTRGANAYPDFSTMVSEGVSMPSYDDAMNYESVNETYAQNHTETPRFSPSANNVPSVIRESFMKNPIQSEGDDLSFLTEDNVKAYVSQKRKKSQNVGVNESVSVAPQTVQVTQQIDYPMIRTIVEEIVRKYTASLSKKLINESANGDNIVNTISFGKTFKLLDSNGNIFECKMEKIGNVKDKKNVNS